MYIEYEDGGDVLSNAPPPPDAAPEIAKQLLKVLVYLHSAQVIHRAIAPHNIVWKRVEDGPVIKLISLGHAKLAKTIEDRELQFVVHAHYNGGGGGGGGNSQPRPKGGALKTKLSEVELRSEFLAPEYKDDTALLTPQDDYAMDWFSGFISPHPPMLKTSREVA